MLSQVHFPQTLNPQDLDQYLADGWFRMGQTIFTTNFLNFKDRFYSALWLRINLNELKPDKKFLRLQKINSVFDMVIKKAEITSEKEQLFALYRSQVSFEASQSLHHLLLGNSTTNVYNSYEITIRDRGALVACGFFDVGKTTAAGITSFYHPDYKKHSLGKYLIYLKVQYCKNTGLSYFYPGYFVPGYAHFDYKLQIYYSSLEYLQLRTASWCTIDEFSPVNVPIDVIRKKLGDLELLIVALRNKGVTVYCYDYFDANLVHALSHVELLDQPMFLSPAIATDGMPTSIIYFDVRDDNYHWAIVESVWSSGAEAPLNDRYTSHLLRIEREYFATGSAEEMAVRFTQEKTFE